METAELVRTTSNCGVNYSMYLYKQCSPPGVCGLEILPLRFKVPAYKKSTMFFQMPFLS